MQIKKKSNKLNKIYIFFSSLVLFIIIFSTTSLYGKSFKVTDLEISEDFGLNFNKEKVIDKGFRKAFQELISMITTSGDKEKIKNISLSTIKSLIDSFTMSEEKFVNNEYKTKFDVTFNKKNTLKFFEKNRVFPSIPKKKKVLLIPVLVNLQSDQIFLYNNNIFYEDWNKNNESYFLLEYLLPSEDIEDIDFLLQNSKSIEDYEFKEMIAKYDLKNFIIAVIFKNNNNFRILSKVKLENSFKIYNQKFEDVNLNAMLTIKEEFDIAVGYSDHTLGIEVAIAAVALGASVIEKHFTLDRDLPGPDHKASLEPNELKSMVDAIRNIEKAMGNGIKRPSSSELKNMPIARKSLVAACIIQEGEVFTETNLTVKRPGTGLSPMRWEEVIGLHASRNFAPDELIEL